MLFNTAFVACLLAAIILSSDASHSPGLRKDEHKQHHQHEKHELDIQAKHSHGNHLDKVKVPSDKEISLPDCLKPSEVEDLKIEAYMGRWYQTHASLIPISTYEKGGSCIIADYKLMSPSLPDLKQVNFEVVNSQYKDGELDQATGEATNKLFPFQKPVDGLWYLKLEYKGKTMFGFYVVQAVGPMIDGLYQWSIVTDITRTSIFVLSRAPSLSAAYTANVVNFAQENGFTYPWNSLVETPQASDCVYPKEL